MAPTVETSYGLLRGAEEKGVCALRGVPFARPPVGQRRLRPPDLPERWSGVRDATHFGPSIYQRPNPTAVMMGAVVPDQHEDCPAQPCSRAANSVGVVSSSWS